MWQLEVLDEGFSLIDNFYKKAQNKQFVEELSKRVGAGILEFLRMQNSYPPMVPCYDTTCTIPKNSSYINSEGICSLLSYNLKEPLVKAPPNQKWTAVIALDILGRGIPESSEIEESYFIKKGSDWVASSKPKCQLGSDSSYYCPFYRPAVRKQFCSMPYDETKELHKYHINFTIMFWYPEFSSRPGVKVTSPEGLSFGSTMTEQLRFKSADNKHSLKIDISHITALEQLRNPGLSHGIPKKYIDPETKKIRELEVLNNALNAIWKEGKLSTKQRRLFHPFSSEYTMIIPKNPPKDKKSIETMYKSLQGELYLFAIKARLFDDLSPLYEFIESEFVRPKVCGLESYSDVEEICQIVASHITNTTYTYPSSHFSFLSYINNTVIGIKNDYFRKKMESTNTPIELSSGVSVNNMAKILTKIYGGNVTGNRTFIYRSISKGLIKPRKDGRFYTLYEKDFNMLSSYIKKRQKHRELIQRLCKLKGYKDISGARKWFNRKYRYLTLQQIEEEIESFRNINEPKKRKDALIDYLVERCGSSFQEAEEYIDVQKSEGFSLEEITQNLLEGGDSIIKKSGGM